MPISTSRPKIKPVLDQAPAGDRIRRGEREEALAAGVSALSSDGKPTGQPRPNGRPAALIDTNHLRLPSLCSVDTFGSKAGQTKRGIVQALTLRTVDEMVEPSTSISCFPSIC